MNPDSAESSVSGAGPQAPSALLPDFLAVTSAAIVGKQVCSLGVLGKDVNRWAVGFGMIPRGEVELIFASIGSARPPA